MSPRRFGVLLALCGTVAFAGWIAARLAGFGSPGIENTDAARIEDRGATRGASVAADIEPVDASQATAMDVSVAHVATAVLAPPEPDVPVAVSIASVAMPDPDPSAPTIVSVAEVATAALAPPEPDVLAAVSIASVAMADPDPSAPTLSVAEAATAALAPPKPGVPVAVSIASVAMPDPDPSAPTVASVAEAATTDPDRAEPAFVLAAVSATHLASVKAALPTLRPPPPKTPPVQVASLTTADPVQDYAKKAVSSEILNECLVADICIDEYLWSLYERTPKVDTMKVPERIKVTVKKKGKTRTVIKTIMKYVDADFTWKDPIAAKRAGMSLKDYVIGGMDRGFRLKLYRALQAMDDAGLVPGITSAFRDDYRQSIASGNKAASDSSYHGGSRRGGFGHGLAADLVSVKGETRMQRYRSSEELWKWIDAHEKGLGIGRPYLDRDPPHVGPTDGKEYADKRGRANGQKAALQAKQQNRLAVRHHPAPAKRARTAKTSKVSSL